MRINYSWVLVIFVGIILRVILSGLLYHTDVKNIYKDAEYLNSDVKTAYATAAADNMALPYPPAVYWIFNANRNINGWMFSDHFNDWLHDGSARQAELHPRIFQDLFAMKFPLMLADLVIGLVLIAMVVQQKKLLVATLWLFNPLVLYSIYGFGNFDVIPTLFLTLGMYFWIKNNKKLAYLMVGLATGLKLFSILLIPLLLIIDNSKWREKMLGIVAFVGGFGLLIGPILTSKAALTSIFLSNLSGTLFKTSIGLAEGHILPLFLLVYFVIIGLLFSKKYSFDFQSVVLVVIGLLLAMSHFHPQWYLWIIPAVILLIAENKISIIYAVSLITAFFGVSLLINDKFVFLGQLKAINESFDSVKPIRAYADIVGVGIQLQGLFQALLLATTGVIVFELMKVIEPIKAALSNKRLITMSVVFWIVMLPTLFLVAHIPLVKYGRYIDYERMDQREKLLLTNETVISQKITLSHDRFSAVLLKMKNVEMRNTRDLMVSIEDSNKSIIRNIKVSGKTIGDDFDMIVFFEPIIDSMGKDYYLVLSQPGAIEELELVIPYDQNSTAGGLSINDIETRGSLAFTLYYNPGNMMGNLMWSINNIKSKLF